MQVLRVFKQLHRTRMDVFKDDGIALKGEPGYKLSCNVMFYGLLVFKTLMP